MHNLLVFWLSQLFLHNIVILLEWGERLFSFWLRCISVSVLNSVFFHTRWCAHLCASLPIEHLNLRKGGEICGSLLCQIGDLEFKCDRWEARASSNTFLLFVHKLLLLGATYFTGFVRSFFRGCFELLSWWSGFGFFSTLLTGTWNYFRMVEVIFVRQILRCRRLLFERLFN